MNRHPCFLKKVSYQLQIILIIIHNQDVHVFFLPANFF